MTMVSPASAQAQPGPTVSTSIDWQSFLARHDLVWDDFGHRDSRGFYASAQIGNGLHGLAIFAEEDNDGDMIFEVGRKDVVATRDPADWTSYIDTNALAKGRLPIGYFRLDPVGTVQSNTMRVDLWNAEARGEMTTSQGTIQWRAFSHATEDYMVVDLETTGGENLASFNFTPRISRFPGLDRRPNLVIEGYEPNPDPEIYTDQGVQVVRQPYLETTGEYATGWLLEEPTVGLRRYYISVARAAEGDAPRTEVVSTVLQAAAGDFPSQLDAHRSWWHTFWPTSFISLPDARLESNYYIQLYRLASATRANKPMIDLLDCWYTGTGWPAIWWNLNTQLSYQWIPATSRLSFHESLNNHLRNNLDNLEANAQGANTISIGKITSFDLREDAGNDVGSFLWIMHSVWLSYRMDMDDDALAEWIYPMMKLAANHVIVNWLTLSDLRYDMKANTNPEYRGGVNANYGLATFRALLQALIFSAERMELNDPDVANYEDILANLAPYPSNEDGWKISETARLERAHRHFSHLMPLYLNLIDLSDFQNRYVAEKSLEHFLTVGGPGGDRTGYTFGGASAMFTRLNRPDEAYSHLRYLVSTVFQPNATYREGGGPVSETAYASAGWTQELFLQQQGEAIALFPGFPASKPEAAFYNLAAEGAFRVSAVRDGGSTAWAHVRSLAGESCVVRGNFQGTPGITGSDGVGLEALGGNTWRITGLDAGEWVLLYRGSTPPTDPTVSPLDGSVDEYNYFGSDRAKDTDEPAYPEVSIRTGSGATVNF